MSSSPHVQELHHDEQKKREDGTLPKKMNKQLPIYW